MTDNTRALLEQALEVIVANTIGKDDLEAAIRAELAKPSAPAWHDAPTEPGVWVLETPYGLEATRIGSYQFQQIDHDEYKGERWYGPIPQDGGK